MRPKSQTFFAYPYGRINRATSNPSPATLGLPNPSTRLPILDHLRRRRGFQMNSPSALGHRHIPIKRVCKCSRCCIWDYNRRNTMTWIRTVLIATGHHAFAIELHFHAGRTPVRVLLWMATANRAPHRGSQSVTNLSLETTKGETRRQQESRGGDDDSLIGRKKPRGFLPSSNKYYSFALNISSIGCYMHEINIKLKKKTANRIIANG